MDQTFRAIIEVVNRATAPLRTIEKGFAGIMAPITGVRLAVGALARETGIVRLSEQAVHATEKVRHLGRELGALVGPVAVIGGIASVEGLFEASKKQAEFGEALGHSSEKTGVDIPTIARLHYVAQLEDVDPEAMDKGLAKLNSNLFKALHGKNKDFAAMMARFEGADWKKKITGVEPAFAAISAAYRKYTNETTRAGIVTTAFGDRMGVSLKPILGKTKDELREMGDEFERFYGKWTPERVAQAKEAEDNWKRLSAAGAGLAMIVGGTVTPAIMEMIVPLREWIANNKELIGQKVHDTVRDIGDSLKATDWKGIGAGLGFVWRGFKGIADLLGAKGMVIASAALLFGPIAVSALNAAVALAVLAKDLALVTARISIVLGLGVFKFFADLVTGIRLAIPALAALDLALSANPIGAAVLAVGALAAAAYVVYDHWKPIAAFFSDVWAKIKAVWEPAKQWFSDLWGGILIELKTLWNAVKPILDKISAFWHRMDSRRADRRTSAEKDRAARNTPAALAAAAGNRTAFNKALGGALAYAGSIVIQLPVAAQAAQVAGSLQHLSDIGRQDRLARERLERQQLSGGALGRGLAGPGASKDKVDVNVNFSNLPRGTQARAETSGNGLNLKVGKSFQEHK
jgi:hypothetical protein